MQENNSTHLEKQSTRDLLSPISRGVEGPRENGVKDSKGNIRLDPDWNLKENLTSDEKGLLHYGVR